MTNFFHLVFTRRVFGRVLIIFLQTTGASRFPERLRLFPVNMGSESGQRNKCHKTGRHTSKGVRNKHRGVGEEVAQRHRKKLKVRFPAAAENSTRGTGHACTWTSCLIEIQRIASRRRIGELARGLSVPFALNRFAMRAVLRYFKSGETRDWLPRWWPSWD